MLLTKEGLEQVSRLRKYSPTLAAAYVMSATETAAKVLTGDKVVPQVAYFESDLKDDLATDFAFVHSLFAYLNESLPEEIASRLPPNVLNLVKFVWTVHSAILQSQAKYPGLRPVWDLFKTHILVKVLNDNIGNARGTLYDFARDLTALVDQPVFLEEGFKDELLKLIDKHFAPPPPLQRLISEVAATEKIPTTSGSPEERPDKPTSGTEESSRAQRSEPPVIQVQQTESVSPEDLLERMLQQLDRYVRLQEEIAAGNNIETPEITSQRQAPAVEQVYELGVRVLPTLSGNNSYVFFKTPITTSAVKQYGELVDHLQTYIKALRRIAENAIRSDIRMDFSTSGRINTHLLPKALTMGLSPFVRVEADDDKSLHIVMLIDESGSMNTYVPLGTGVERQRSGNPLLGAASGIAANRATLAKYTAIILNEGLKNSDTRLEAFGYANTRLPEPMDSLDLPYVRSLPGPALATITATSDNADLAALSHAYSILKVSPSRNRVIIYLADGEIRSDALVTAFDKVLSSGIHVFWLDLSGRDGPRNSSLAPAKRYVIRNFQNVLNAMEDILRTISEWYA